MIRPCSGLDSKKKLARDNDEEHGMSHRLGFDNCAFAAQRRVLQHIPLQDGHPSRAFGPNFLAMKLSFSFTRQPQGCVGKPQ
jgi:hypothetical protein